MAASAATAAILVLFDSAVFSTDVIAFAVEVIGMAGGTERRVLGPRECNIFVIALVTRTAGQVDTVVTRIVTAKRMREINRRPGLGGMTVIAFRDGNKVIIQALRFTTDCRRAIVAGRATTANALMIEGAADEGGGGMTERAIQAGRYMIR